LNDTLGTSLLDVEVDTVGGWLFKHNLDAKEGTQMEHDQYTFIIDEMDGYQIKKVKIIMG
jgi:CBS domain containing-hemolysin-like protein